MGDNWWIADDSDAEDEPTTFQPAGPQVPAQAPVTHQTPVTHQPDATQPKTTRSTGRLLVSLALAAVVLIGVGSGAWVLVGFFRSGGAGSPEAAVNALADAVNAQDPLLAASVINPKELPFLTDLLAEVGSAQERVGVGGKGKPVPGTEVKVTGLRLKAKELGPRVSRVTIRSGRLESSVNPKDLPGIVRELIEDQDPEPYRAKVELSELLEDVYVGDSYADLDLNLIVVKEGRGWYVSPAMTVADMFGRLADIEWSTGGDRQVNFDDFGESDGFDKGADSPDGAIDDLADAISSGDVGALVAALPSDLGQFGLVYAEILQSAYEHVMAESDFRSDKLPNNWFRLKSLDTTESGGPRGTRRVMVDSARAEIVDADGYSSTFEIDGLRIRKSDYGYTDLDLSGPDKLSRWVTDSLGGSASLIVRKIDGGWKVDPVSSLLDMATRLVARIDKELVESVTMSVDGDAQKIEVGSTTELTFPDNGLARVSFPTEPGGLYVVVVEDPQPPADPDDQHRYLSDMDLVIGFKNQKENGYADEPTVFIGDGDPTTIAVGGIHHGFSSVQLTVSKVQSSDREFDTEINGKLTAPVEMHRIPVSATATDSTGGHRLVLEGTATHVGDDSLRLSVQDRDPSDSDRRIQWIGSGYELESEGLKSFSTGVEVDGDHAYVWIQGVVGDSYSYRLSEERRGFDGRDSITVRVPARGSVDRSFEMGESYSVVRATVDWDERVDVDSYLYINGRIEDSNTSYAEYGPETLRGSGSGKASVNLRNYGNQDATVEISLVFVDD